MSSLKTYDLRYKNGERADLGLVVVDAEGDAKTHWIPGEWVTDRAIGGFGMIVATNDDQLTILWSVEPEWPDVFNVPAAGFVFAPHVPLQITPSILAPEEFAPKKGIRYYANKVKSHFYGTITISDIK